MDVSNVTDFIAGYRSQESQLPSYPDVRHETCHDIPNQTIHAEFDQVPVDRSMTGVSIALLRY